MEPAHQGDAVAQRSIDEPIGNGNRATDCRRQVVSVNDVLVQAQAAHYRDRHFAEGDVHDRLRRIPGRVANSRDGLLGRLARGLLQPCRLPGRHRLKPLPAIGKVNGQIESSPIFSEGIHQHAQEELVAGGDVGDEVPGGPALAERGFRPAVIRDGIDGLEIPVARLPQPAGRSYLRVHLRNHDATERSHATSQATLARGAYGTMCATLEGRIMVQANLDNALEEGREAVRRHAWREAYE